MQRFFAIGHLKAREKAKIGKLVAQIAFFRSFGPSKPYVVLKTKSIFFGIKVFYTELLNFLQLLGDKFCEKREKTRYRPKLQLICL